MGVDTSLADAVDSRRFIGINSIITVYRADCVALRELIGTVDAVVTDPPYGIGFASQPTNYQRYAGQKPEFWDEAPAVGLMDMITCAPVRVVWGGNYYTLPPSRGWLSWYKPDAPPSMASIELAWTNVDQNARQIAWSIAATNSERVGHPTQKPVRVMAWSMDQVKIPRGAVVLDPYMGSGTTAIACIRTGRNFVGVEIDEKHFRTACERIEREIDGQLL